MANENDLLKNASDKLILDTAKDIVEQVARNSTLFDARREDLFCNFDYEELRIGRVLGKGRFSVVKEVTGIEVIRNGRSAALEKKKNRLQDYGEEYAERYLNAFTRDYLVKNQSAMQSGKKKMARYAIKILSQDCKHDRPLYLNGAVDIAVEAKFLAVLEHPHIVKMRATSGVGLFDEMSFIILDRLNCTLDEKMKKWRTKARQSSGILGMMKGGKKKKHNDLTVTRLIASYDLATALRYLHERHIIYRDLKPENIGFDVRGELKIFDFGLAKELKPASADKSGCYNLTGWTGSPRYMAPEVAKSEPYNLTADVYSFAIVFWSIMSLEVPFGEFTPEMHNEAVIYGGHRPACHVQWPNTWRELMESCWDENINSRRSIEEVCHSLSKLVEEVRDTSNGEDLDSSIRGSVKKKSINREDELEKSTGVDISIVSERKRAGSLSDSLNSPTRRAPQSVQLPNKEIKTLAPAAAPAVLAQEEDDEEEYEV